MNQNIKKSGQKELILLHSLEFFRISNHMRWILQRRNYKKSIIGSKVHSIADCSCSSRKYSRLKKYFDRKKKSSIYAKASIALSKEIATTIIVYCYKWREYTKTRSDLKEGEIQRRKVVETVIY